MGKKVLKRCLIGAPAGLAAWVLFTLLGSWLRGTGEYYFISGHMVFVYGTELNAVTLSCASAMALGVLWSAAGLLYQVEGWSLTKQTLAHFGVCVLPSLAVVWAMQWMPRNLDGLGQYLRLFAGIYGIVWAVQYFEMRRKVRQWNEKLAKMREQE